MHASRGLVIAAAQPVAPSTPPLLASLVSVPSWGLPLFVQTLYFPDYVGDKRVLLATEDAGEFMLDDSYVGVPQGAAVACWTS